jgi:hypothetical protein
MKAFIIACVAFGVLVVFLFGSSAWLSQCAENLSSDALPLASLPPDEREGAMNALCERWERERFRFIVFVHKEELVPLEGALTRARAAAEIKSDSDYQIAVAEVQAELAHLGRQVGLHMEGIF